MTCGNALAKPRTRITMPKNYRGPSACGKILPPLNSSVIIAKMVAWIRCVSRRQSRARFGEVRRGAAPLRPG